MSVSIRTAVAIFGFNRPDCLVQVFNRVREVKPTKLFLVLDAPRSNRLDDIPKWEACKKIFEGVDWACDVYRNYANENMGCRWRMTTGISWVFEHVEEAILLEDDCVPHIDFFPFCAELLERYRHDSRIGMIAGHQAHLSVVEHETSYYFDRFNTIWGWATWRRAWNTFDSKMDEWPKVRRTTKLKSVFVTKSLTQTFFDYFDAVYEGKVSSWATAWFLSCLRQGYLCIHPCVNLITNIGIVGAHNSERCRFHFVPTEAIQFPLKHPADFIPSEEDEAIMRRRYNRPHIAKRIASDVKRTLKSIIRSLAFQHQGKT
jgi:hypothetical protein